MSTKIYKFDQAFKNLINETGYKHIAMESPEGERIVSYNQAKQPLAKKWDEIRRRLNVLPDGFYKILAQYNYSGKSKADSFIIQKGNPKDNLQEDEVKITRTPAVIKTKEEKSHEQIMSLPEALKRIEELAKLNVEVIALRKQVEDDDKYIKELE